MTNRDRDTQLSAKQNEAINREVDLTKDWDTFSRELGSLTGKHIAQVSQIDVSTPRRRVADE